MKKVLILHTSVGLGHKTIAQNISWHLEAAGFEVKLIDVYKTQSGKLIDFFTVVYNVIAFRLPFIWNFLYSNPKIGGFLSRFRLGVAAKNYMETKKVIDEFKPDILITTQTAASAIGAFLKQKKIFTGSLGIAFSDFHLHRFWLYKEADFYLANIEEQKNEMVKLGILPEKIFVCGMALKPVENINTIEARKALGILPEEKVVLIGSGSLGTGMDLNLIAEISKQPNTRSLVVCGKNNEIYEKLKKEYSGSSVIVLPFYEHMQELYAIANIFITKPGGLSIAEALHFRLPIIISHLLPGQEHFNYEYLVKKGWIMPKEHNIAEQVKEELVTGKFKKRLAADQTVNNLFNGGSVIAEAASRQSK